jgi:hypothetical protein
MHTFLKRLAALAIATIVITPSIAGAAELSAAQRSAIENAGGQLFRSVVDGNIKGVVGHTTPSFAVTTLEGQTLSASDLASKWRAMMIEYGGVHGDVKLRSASIDGNTITTLFSVTAFADGSRGGYDLPHTSMLHALHEIVWVPVGGTWKAASDRVLHESSDFRSAPSL